VPALVHNEADFRQVLAAGHTVQLIHAGNKQPIRLIFSWADAVAAARDTSKSLQLLSIAAVYEDVSTLRKAVQNRATGMESQTNYAIAHDPELQRKCGATLRVLNDGRGIKFFFQNGIDAVLEVDGLVITIRGALLVNECKSALDRRHIVGAPASDTDPGCEGILERATRLKGILTAPHLFRSEPPEVMVECAHKEIVPVASGFMATAEAEKECRSLGIELLKPQGPGGSYAVGRAAESLMR